MKRQHRSSLADLTRAAVCAALYVALTVTPPLSSLAFGAVQLRVSEALCVLAFLFPKTGVGLILGCLISNFFSPMILPLDLILGTSATALGVLGTLWLRRIQRPWVLWLIPLPTVLANALIVPVIICCSMPSGSFFHTYLATFCSVGAGEVLSTYALGLPLYFLLKKFAPTLQPR